MKVLYIHQHFSTPQGKVGIRSYQMARELLRSGHQVNMICGSYAGAATGLSGPFIRRRREGIVDGINIIEFDMSYSNSDGFIKRCLTFGRFAVRSSWVALTADYDLLFATTTPLTVGIPGMVGHWLRAKRFVFEVRDLWPELPRKMGVIKNPVVLKLMDILEWSSYRSADKCVALSPGIAKGIEACGVSPDRIEMVPNGCDIDIFSDSKLKPWRPDVVSPNDLLAVFSGTHGIANGLVSVIAAAEVLKARGRADIKLVLVGNGKEKPKLEQMAREMKLDNLIFLAPVSKSDLAGLLAASDIGMQILANIPAFYFGTSPNKFFDYIASGLPVLNNYPGWLADLITEHKCGFAVEPDSPEAFALALEQAADDRLSLKKMGINGLKLAQDQFSRAILAKRWVKWVTS